MATRLRPRLIQLIVGLLVTTVLVGPSWAQDSIKDARQKRDSAVNAQANAAAQINFLKAQDADVAEAVQQVNLAVTAQQARVEAAQQGIASAEQESATQNALVAEAQVQITGVRAQVGALLVEDYMVAPPRTRRPSFVRPRSSKGYRRRRSSMRFPPTGAV